MRKNRWFYTGEALKQKMLQAADDLQRKAEILRGLATEKIELVDGMQVLGYSQNERQYRVTLNRLRGNDFLPLVSKSFRDTGIKGEDIDRIFLMSESPAMKLMRDVFDLRDDQYLDPETFDDDAIWEIVARYTNEHELFVLKEKYGESDRWFETTFADIQHAAKEKLMWDVTPSRINQLYLSTVRKMRRVFKYSREREAVVKAIFGVDYHQFKNNVITIADALIREKDGNEISNTTLTTKGDDTKTDISESNNVLTTSHLDIAALFSNEVIDRFNLRLLGGKSNISFDKHDDYLDFAACTKKYMRDLKNLVGYYSVPEKLIEVILGWFASIIFSDQKWVWCNVYSKTDYTKLLEKYKPMFTDLEESVQRIFPNMGLEKYNGVYSLFGVIGCTVYDLVLDAKLLENSVPLLVVLEKYGVMLNVYILENEIKVYDTEMFISEYIKMATEYYRYLLT